MPPFFPSENHNLQGVKRDNRPPAMAPETLVHVGERFVEQTSIRIYDFSPESFAEHQAENAHQCLSLEKADSPSWIAVTGLHDPVVVRQVLSEYKIHPLLLQDIINTTHPSKLEESDDYLFIIARILKSGQGDHSQHFAMVLTKRVLITFQEAPTAIFEPVIARLRESRGRLRSLGVDHLCWALLDTVMDHYLVSLGELEDRVADFEGKLMSEMQVKPDMTDLYNMRGESILINRQLRPLREVVARLQRLESHHLLSPGLTPYLRDLYDHAWHANEISDHLRESITGLREFHQSNLAQKMNEVMKVLAAISTLFLPLSFIAGIYGMNFDHQPELHWKYGYVGIWGVFIGLSLFMWWYFRRKKWL